MLQAHSSPDSGSWLRGQNKSTVQSTDLPLPLPPSNPNNPRKGMGKEKTETNPQFLPAGCEYHRGCRGENVLVEWVP